MTKAWGFKLERGYFLPNDFRDNTEEGFRIAISASGIQFCRVFVCCKIMIGYPKRYCYCLGARVLPLDLWTHALGVINNSVIIGIAVAIPNFISVKIPPVAVIRSRRSAKII